MVQLTRDGVPLQTVVAEIQDKSIEVLVDQTFPVAQIGEALARQASGHAHGKIIVTGM